MAIDARRNFFFRILERDFGERCVSIERNFATIIVISKTKRLLALRWMTVEKRRKAVKIGWAAGRWDVRVANCHCFVAVEYDEDLSIVEVAVDILVQVSHVMRYLAFKSCCLSTTEDDYNTLSPRILVGLIISLPFSVVDVNLAIFQSHGHYSQSAWTFGIEGQMNFLALCFSDPDAQQSTRVVTFEP